MFLNEHLVLLKNLCLNFNESFFQKCLKLFIEYLESLIGQVTLNFYLHKCFLQRLILQKKK